VRDLLVATNNAGKLAEFRRLLSGLPVRVVAPKEIGLQLMVPEPHLAYAENARDKAVAFAGSSGLLSLADDSGIEVAALDWGPGARSRTWDWFQMLVPSPISASGATSAVRWMRTDGRSFMRSPAVLRFYPARPRGHASS